MHRSIAVVCLTVIFCFSAIPAIAQKISAEEQKAIDAIRSLEGCTVSFDPTGGQAVSLLSRNATDAILKQLKQLTDLRRLQLIDTGVTDAGLRELKDLSRLQELTIASTRITDVGLKELRGLTRLRELHLACNLVTDVGLQELKSLRNLESLSIVHVKVTKAGFDELRRALPKLTDASVFFAKIPSLLLSGPLEPAEGDDELRKLLKARYNEAIAEMDVHFQVYFATVGLRFNVDSMIDVSRRLVQSGLELSRVPEDRAVFLTSYIELMREIEARAQRQYEGGTLPINELHRIRYYRLDGQIQLLRERKKSHETPGK